MKRLNTNLSGMAMLVVFIMLSGCQKLQDYLIKHPDATHPNCRIVKFSSTSNYPKENVEIFYNKFGNPDSVKFDNPATTQTNFYMFYDKKKRLTDCIAMTKGSDVDTANGMPAVHNDLTATFQWKKFVYDHHDRVIVDTTFNMPLYKPGVLRPMSWTGSFEVEGQWFQRYQYDYDSKDRIIRSTMTTPSPNDAPEVKEFNYGADGNLIDSRRSYDSQVSFLRTHKIWMLLSLDYSVNNPFPAVAYNNNGLPLKFNYIPPSDYWNYFLFTDMAQSTIEYSCD